MTESETVELIGQIANVFPSRLPSTVGAIGQMARVWHSLLQDLPARDVFEAAREYFTQDREHPPGVGQIRSLAVNRKLDLPDEAAAWEEVRRAIQRCGRDREPPWSSTAVTNAVASLGWTNLCNSLIEDEPTWRAHFFKALMATSTREQRRENIGSLEKAAPDVLRLVGDVTKKLTGK